MSERSQIANSGIMEMRVCSAAWRDPGAVRLSRPARSSTRLGTVNQNAWVSISTGGRWSRLILRLPPPL